MTDNICKCTEWDIPKMRLHVMTLGQHCLNCNLELSDACLDKLYPIEKKDAVNHPSHYQSNGLEAIDVIEAFQLNFCLGNSLKYILRAGKKDSKKQDLKKAIWYLEREIEKNSEQ